MTCPHCKSADRVEPTGDNAWGWVCLRCRCAIDGQPVELAEALVVAESPRGGLA